MAHGRKFCFHSHFQRPPRHFLCAPIYGAFYAKHFFAMKNTFITSLQLAFVSSALLIGSPSLAQVTVQKTSATFSAGTISEMKGDRIVIKSETAPAPLSYTFDKSTVYVDEAGAPVTMDVVKSGLPVTVYYDTVGDARVATKVIVKKTTTAGAAAGAIIGTGAPVVVEAKKTIMPTSGASTATVTTATPAVTSTTTTNAPGATKTTTVNIPATSATTSVDTTNNRASTVIGTVKSIAPDRFVLVSDASPDAPLTFIPTQTTAYVDETGAAVPADVVKTGLPLTVYYGREGTNLVATKVIVRRSTVALPVTVPGATVIETGPVTRETTTVVKPAAPIVEEKKTTTTTKEN